MLISFPDVTDVPQEGQTFALSGSCVPPYLKYPFEPLKNGRPLHHLAVVCHSCYKT